MARVKPCRPWGMPTVGNATGCDWGATGVQRQPQPCSARTPVDVNTEQPVPPSGSYSPYSKSEPTECESPCDAAWVKGDVFSLELFEEDALPEAFVLGATTQFAGTYKKTKRPGGLPAYVREDSGKAFHYQRLAWRHY